MSAWGKERWWKNNQNFLVLFLLYRFLRVVQCDLILKHCVFQYIQVLYFSYQVFVLLEARTSFFFTFLFYLPAEKLHSLSDKKWTLFLSKMCSSLEEQNGSTFVASSTASVTPVSAARSKLNLLCYLCSVAGHEHVANKLINSELVGQSAILF